MPLLLPALAPALALTLLLGGCASGPRPASPADRDGPEANPPKDLLRVPDAEPQVEPLRSGGPNRPYEVLGRRYEPFMHDRPFVERGLASWYGRKFHGKRTSSGEPYDMYAMTAAHPTMPLPSYARVRNPANGREVVVRVNDRGPFHPGRIIDLSYTAALKLDLLRGVAPVEVERITHEAIRSGAWRRDGAVAVAAPTGATAPAALPAALAAEPAVASNIEPAPGAGPTAPVAPIAAVASTAASAVPSANAPAAPPAPLAPSAPAVAAPATAPAAPTTTAPAAAPPAVPLLPDVSRANAYWVQLGAFRQREGAEDFQRRVAAELDWPIERLAVFDDAALYRLQAGPYASRAAARSAAEHIRQALQLVPVVLERR